jgi:hypothetical protein
LAEGWLEGRREIFQNRVSLPYFGSQAVTHQLPYLRKWRVTWAKLKGENPSDTTYISASTSDDEFNN